MAVADGFFWSERDGSDAVAAVGTGSGRRYGKVAFFSRRLGDRCGSLGRW